MHSTWRSLVSVAILLLSLSWSALATHEANHRYNVRGYVLDADRQPLVDVAVSVRLDGQSLGGARTDAKGFYSAHLHLHDGNIGQQLEIRAGDRTGTVRMRGARGDLSSARVHYANFVGDDLVEEDLGSPGLPVWAYGGAVALLGTAALAWTYVRKRKRATRRAAKAEEPAPRPQKRVQKPRRKPRPKKRKRR
jgi:hypothetical protein